MQSHVFDPALVYDRAYGAIFGGALGDALGLQTEGDSPHTIADRHPEGPAYPYKGAYKGYPCGDWTDATDFTVLVMRTLGAYFSGRDNDPGAHFAAAVRRWCAGGFPELGDTVGVNPESVVSRVVGVSGFGKDPIGAARSLKGPKAENGALLRAAPCAFTAAPADWVLLFSETTHADDRCAASALMFARLLGVLSRVPDDGPLRAAMAQGPVEAGRQHIADQARRADYMARLTNTATLAALKLGDRDTPSFTLRTLSVAMWAFRALLRTPPEGRDAAFFKATVVAVASQGGDASANCAVAGAVLGAALGHRRLPADWLGALPNREWLERETAAFLQAAADTWGLP